MAAQCGTSRIFAVEWGICLSNALFLSYLFSSEYCHDKSYIAGNSILWATLISVANSMGLPNFNHGDATGPQTYRIWWNNANHTAITPFKVITAFSVPIKSPYATSYQWIHVTVTNILSHMSFTYTVRDELLNQDCKIASRS